jgi:glucosamine--fructose-6-phosphate aminotransferase (isomerizing)
LHAALANETANVVVLSHTRWASVGVISEANAHPLDQAELGRFGTAYVAAALNGDVDNYAELVGLHQLQIAPEITTDAKVIPALMARGIDGGLAPIDAFRDAVASFEGSVAIGAHTSAAPGRVFLALRGSGQGLYIGLADDTYIVASEPYGVVEETHTYLRLDGETPANPDNPSASRGQIVVLDRYNVLTSYDAKTGAMKWSQLEGMYDATNDSSPPTALCCSPSRNSHLRRIERRCQAYRSS